MLWQMRFGDMELLGLLFGPRLLSMLSRGKTVFDPVRVVISYVVYSFASLMGL